MAEFKEDQTARERLEREEIQEEIQADQRGEHRGEVHVQTRENINKPARETHGGHHDQLNHEHHEHHDPLTGTPGAHPLGTGVGAAGAGTAGAAIGAAAGPVGALAGAALGAVVGGLIGKGVAEGIDPTEEHAFWRETYKDRPYYDQGFTYEEDYEPAYRYGWETRKKFHDRRFEDVEPHLKEQWPHRKEESSLSWDHAKHAVRDAWHRIEQRAHHHKK